MVAQSLNESILQGKTGRVLEAINKAEAVLGRQQIDFPRIAVFGDESTGKSSMLEAICKIPFPRGNKTTTKCPTVLRLQRAQPGTPWSATAWAGHREAVANHKNEIHVKDPEDLRKAIADLQAQILGKDGAKFSSEAVTVKVTSGDVVDLTMVDLPGYFTHAGLDARGDNGEVMLVRDLLLSFLRDQNTIVLVVVPADQLVKTINIFNLLKDYEKNLSEQEKVKLHARTIYCFTKCDRVAGKPGTENGAPFDMEEILYNTGAFKAEPHGWYAVVNKDSTHLRKSDFLTRLDFERENEAKFFDVTTPYSNIDLRGRCGTENVVQKLSSMLAEKISEKVQSMLQQAERSLSQASKELQQLGSPPPEDRNVRSECRTIIDDIKTYYMNATNGLYGELGDEVDDIPEKISQDDFNKCKLGYRRKKRCEKFAREIRESRLPLHDAAYLKELRKKVEEARDGKMEYSMPVPEVAFEEVRKCVKKWHALGETMCNEIADSAIQCLKVLVRVKANKYENLPRRLNDHYKKMIEEQRSKAITRLGWHYVDEIMRPDTFNELFKKGIDGTKNLPGMGKNRDANRDNYVCNLDVYFPIAEARYIDNAIRTVTTHIFDVPIGKRRARVVSDQPPTFTLQALQISDGGEEKLMKIRDDLAQKRKSQSLKVQVLEGLRDALLDMPTTPAETKVEVGEFQHGGSTNGVVDGYAEDDLEMLEKEYGGSNTDYTGAGQRPGAAVANAMGHQNNSQPEHTQYSVYPHHQPQQIPNQSIPQNQQPMQQTIYGQNFRNPQEEQPVNTQPPDNFYEDPALLARMGLLRGDGRRTTKNSWNKK